MIYRQSCRSRFYFKIQYQLDLWYQTKHLARCPKIIPKILLGITVNHVLEKMVMCLAICVKGKFPLVQIRRIEALDPLKNTLKTDLGRIIQCWEWYSHFWEKKTTWWWRTANISDTLESRCFEKTQIFQEEQKTNCAVIKPVSGIFF